MQIKQGGRSVYVAPWRVRRLLRQLGQARHTAGWGSGLPSQRLAELRAALGRAWRSADGWVAPAYGGLLWLRLLPGGTTLDSLGFALSGAVTAVRLKRLVENAMLGMGDLLCRLPTSMFVVEPALQHAGACMH